MNGFLKCVICYMPGLLLLGFASASVASPVQDQSQQTNNGSYIFYANKPVAQTFTAGINGQLTSVDVWLGSFASGSSNVTLQVVDTIAGAPSGATLGSKTELDPSNGWWTVDLSGADIMLQTGMQYGIVLTDDDPSPSDPSRYANVRWSNVYLGGALWDQSTGSWAPTTLDPTSPGDMAFRTWMVAVPEPATAAILLPLLLSRTRRR